MLHTLRQRFAPRVAKRRAKHQLGKPDYWLRRLLEWRGAPFLYDGTLHDLRSIGGNSAVFAINSAGVIAGTSGRQFPVPCFLIRWIIARSRNVWRQPDQWFCNQRCWWSGACFSFRSNRSSATCAPAPSLSSMLTGLIAITLREILSVYKKRVLT